MLMKKRVLFQHNIGIWNKIWHTHSMGRLEEKRIRYINFGLSYIFRMIIKIILTFEKIWFAMWHSIFMILKGNTCYPIIGETDIFIRRNLRNRMITLEWMEQFCLHLKYQNKYHLLYELNVNKQNSWNEIFTVFWKPNIFAFDIFDGSEKQVLPGLNICIGDPI